MIYLSGMMVSGKTTVGKALGEQLNIRFIDLDDEIERRYLESAASIIRKKGPSYFRTLESETLTSLDYTKESVVALGGGAVLSTDNVSFMKKTGRIVYLKCSLETLLERLNGEERAKRPLAADIAEFRLIYKNREALYEKTADMTIICDHLSISDIVAKIIEHLN